MVKDTHETNAILYQYHFADILNKKNFGPRIDVNEWKLEYKNANLQEDSDYLSDEWWILFLSNKILNNNDVDLADLDRENCEKNHFKTLFLRQLMNQFNNVKVACMTCNEEVLFISIVYFSQVLLTAHGARGPAAHGAGGPNPFVEDDEEMADLEAFFRA